MSARVKKWAMFAIRWGIAVAGIWYVLVNISWRDQALVLDADNRPHKVRLAEPWDEQSPTVTLLDPVPGVEDKVVPISRLVHEADRDEVRLRLEEGVQVWPLLAVDLARGPRGIERVERVLAADVVSGRGVWFDASRVVGGYELRVPFPLVQSGLGHMLQTADPQYLWAAMLIFPLTFLITGLRWYLLLRALNIHLGMARAFILNMVGAFYNTFMPGSTGGDLLKAYYAAKHTPLRTRAVMSVIVDRAIGLVALIILGGTMAALQWHEPACRQIAIGAAALMAALVIGLLVFYVTPLRRASGLAFVLRRLPMQRQVTKAVDAMEIYRRRPWLALGALVGSLPVHMTVVMSAVFAGEAFDLPLEFAHYWFIVPVVVLVGSLPISPQGAGVMEFFAILLTRPHGCTVAQAFALTMSIRIVQVLWNLTGGILVLRGGYHAPTEKEQAEQEEEEEDSAGTTSESEAQGTKQAPRTKKENEEQPVV